MIRYNGLRHTWVLTHSLKNDWSLSHCNTNLSRGVWHVVPYFLHAQSLFSLSPPPPPPPPLTTTPLPLLDLLFSLVRVCLMPLSMLIVHRSKAAFIKMIKHSQTTAEYLKASGRGTWQVTTSHTNSPTPVLPAPAPSHRRRPYTTPGWSQVAALCHTSP